jgi:hypothetical protein
MHRTLRVDCGTNKEAVLKRILRIAMMDNSEQGLRDDLDVVVEIAVELGFAPNDLEA